MFAKIILGVLVGFLACCVVCTIGVVYILCIDIKNEQDQDDDWYR